MKSQLGRGGWASKNFSSLIITSWKGGSRLVKPREGKRLEKKKGMSLVVGREKEGRKGDGQYSPKLFAAYLAPVGKSAHETPYSVLSNRRESIRRITGYGSKTKRTMGTKNETHAKQHHCATLMRPEGEFRFPSVGEKGKKHR